MSAEKMVENGVAPVKPGWITLARHGRPALDRSQRMDWRGFVAWWAAYDLGGLEPGQSPPEALRAAAQEAHVIYASTLRRAVETAQAVVGDRPFQTDPVFVEAPLPPPALPGRFRPSTWGVFSRISWWCGVSRDQESRRMAELRAEAAAATILARSLRGENVLVLGHGWFNRMLRPVLKRHGFVCVTDQGDHYWSCRRYERTRI